MGHPPALLNPRLAKPESAPIPDREPKVAERLRSLLAAAGRGKLSAEEFAYVRAGFFPATAKRYEEMLRLVGEPQRFDLLERKELGDDRVYHYRVSYAGRVFEVTLGLAPDNKISDLEIEVK